MKTIKEFNLQISKSVDRSNIENIINKTVYGEIPHPEISISAFEKNYLIHGIVTTDQYTTLMENFYRNGYKYNGHSPIG